MTAAEIRSTATEVTIGLIRNVGFEKVRLSDVAKGMGVSHAALYSHFADKAALLDAVTQQWLASTDEELEKICRSRADPVLKIQQWFLKRYELKRLRVTGDPQLYRAFDAASERKKPFVLEHLRIANRQLVGLLKEAKGMLGRAPPQQQASILLEAMAAFHHPRLVAGRLDEKREPLLRRVLATLLAGMAASDSP